MGDTILVLTPDSFAADRFREARAKAASLIQQIGWDGDATEREFGAMLLVLCGWRRTAIERVMLMKIAPTAIAEDGRTTDLD